MTHEERFDFKKIHKKLVDEVFNDTPFYIVGGAVRDHFMGVKSHDIDFATPLKPDEIKKKLNVAGLFWTPDKTAEAHGIFRVIDPWKECGVVDVATFRIDEETDGRHATVKFTDDILVDLGRRDLTINAMAYRVDAGAVGSSLIDPYGGHNDCWEQEVTLVGDPEERIREDRLRMLRVARFATKLGKGSTITASTVTACRKYASEISQVSKERIREEILKALEYKDAGRMFRFMNELGLLEHICPDLFKGVGCVQNKHHKDDVFEHLCHCVDSCSAKKYTPLLKLATMFHDVAKPHTKKMVDGDATFHNHETVGATIVYNWMKEYKFSNAEIMYVVKMVRHHQWRFEDSTTEKTYRKWLQEVGRDHWRDLVRLRIADRRGNRAKDGRPSITQKMKELIKIVRTMINRGDPLFIEDLAINGDDLKKLGLKPGPEFKSIISNIMGIVVNDPSKNTTEWLTEFVQRNYINKQSKG